MNDILRCSFKFGIYEGNINWLPLIFNDNISSSTTDDITTKYLHIWKIRFFSFMFTKLIRIITSESQWHENTNVNLLKELGGRDPKDHSVECLHHLRRSKLLRSWAKTWISGIWVRAESTTLLLHARSKLTCCYL